MSEKLLIERLKSLAEEVHGPVREALLDAAMALSEADALAARLAEAHASLAEGDKRYAAENARLQARLASYEEDERDMNPVYHCGCIFDPECKDGNASPTSECLYHERLRARLAEAEAIIDELCAHEGAEGWSQDLNERLTRFSAPVSDE